MYIGSTIKTAVAHTNRKHLNILQSTAVMPIVSYIHFVLNDGNICYVASCDYTHTNIVHCVDVCIVECRNLSATQICLTNENCIENAVYNYTVIKMCVCDIPYITFHVFDIQLPTTAI